MLGVGECRQIFRFGIFELDSGNGELRKHGVRIKLQDQPRQILMLLLRQSGEVVTREQIQDHLWPGDTFVDFDNAINSAIRKLRDALSDTASNPRFIETLARQGYRFVSPVSCQPQGVQEKELAPPAAPHILRKYRWRILAALAATIALALTLKLVPPGSSGGMANIRVSPLTANLGLELQPSFSPDGTRVAYVWNGVEAKNFSIYTKLIGAGEPVRLTKDVAREFSPAWSPDGRWVAALRDLGRQSAVILIPASGGQPRELARVDKAPDGFNNCPSTDWPHTCGLVYWGSLLAWSPDGKYLFTSGYLKPDSPRAVIRVSVDTGEQHAVTSPPATSGDVGAVVSPDGRNLAFFREVGAKTGDLYVVPLKGAKPLDGPPLRITHDGADVESLAWSHDGRELVFSSDRGGQREIWRVGVSASSEPRRAGGMGERATDLAVSSDGRRLVYSRASYLASLWKIPIDAANAGAPVRVTAMTARDKFSHWSPDGKRIVFQSARSGVDEIWVCDADGSNAVQLTSFGKGLSGSPRWSPDGQTVAFDSNVSSSFSVYLIGVAGGSAVKVTTQPGSHAVPSWSRDGKWIYYASWLSGRGDLWKSHPDGSSRTQVTNGGGCCAVESPDGKTLYFIRGDGEADLLKMPVDGGAAVKVLSSVQGRIFTVTNQGIYFAAGSPVPELRYFDFGTGSIRGIAPLSNFAHADVSGDERWVLYPSADTSSANLMVVENFR